MKKNSEILEQLLRDKEIHYLGQNVYVNQSKYYNQTDKQISIFTSPKVYFVKDFNERELVGFTYMKDDQLAEELCTFKQYDSREAVSYREDLCFETVNYDEGYFIFIFQPFAIWDEFIKTKEVNNYHYLDSINRMMEELQEKLNNAK